MNKEVPLKERIEKLYESGYVNEFNYLENQLQEARCLVTILHKQTEEQDKKIERLKGIAHKMHLWIFLHSGDEQKVYDELGLTDEENAMLGYSGQFRIGGGDESE